MLWMATALAALTALPLRTLPVTDVTPATAPSADLRSATRLSATRPASAADDPSTVPVTAGQAPAETPIDTPDEIVVVATRTPTPPLEVPYQVRTVHSLSGDSAASARTAADAFHELPQVMVQKTSYGQGSPYLRGFTGFRTLVMVDGIRLNNSVFRDGPNQYATLIDPLALDGAEVVFGPSSVLYGSDAIGGTLSYSTRTPRLADTELETHGRVHQRFSSAEGSSVSRLEGSVATPRFALHVGGSYRDFDDLDAGRHQGVLENTGYTEWASDAKFVMAVADDTNLELAFQRHEQIDIPRTHSTVFGQSYRGTTIGSDLRRDLSEVRELAYARLNWNPSTDRRGDLTLYRSRLDEEELRTRSNGRTRLQGFDDTILGANLHYSDRTSLGLITTGLEYSREGVDSFYREFNADGSLRELRTRGPVADQATYQTWAVYLEDRVDVSDRVELSVGGRFTHIAVDADEVDPVLTDATMIASINETYSDGVGSVRGLWRASNTLSLFAGASQSFRAPNLSDLTRFDASRSGEAEIPAPELDPERFLTFEVGGRLRNKTIELEASYYYTLIDDLIARVPTGTVDADGNTVVTKDNVGDGFAHGVEINANVQLDEELSAFAGFGWVEGTVETFSQPGVRSDEPLSRLAPPTGIVGFRFEPASTTVKVEVDLRVAGDADRLSTRDKADTQRIPVGGTPGYAVLGVRGSWSPCDSLRVFAGVENVTNRDYRIHGSGNNEPGVNVVAGFDWRF